MERGRVWSSGTAAAALTGVVLTGGATLGAAVAQAAPAVPHAPVPPVCTIGATTYRQPPVKPGSAATTRPAVVADAAGRCVDAISKDLLVPADVVDHVLVRVPAKPGGAKPGAPRPTVPKPVVPRPAVPKPVVPTPVVTKPAVPTPVVTPAPTTTTTPRPAPDPVLASPPSSAPAATSPVANPTGTSPSATIPATATAPVTTTPATVPSPAVGLTPATSTTLPAGAGAGARPVAPVALAAPAVPAQALPAPAGPAPASAPGNPLAVGAAPIGAGIPVEAPVGAVVAPASYLDPLGAPGLGALPGDPTMLQTLGGNDSGVTTSSRVQALGLDALHRGGGVPAVLGVTIMAGLGGLALRHRILRRIRDAAPAAGGFEPERDEVPTTAGRHAR